MNGGEREPLVLWSGTVGFESRVLDRIEAAQAAGCDRFSLSAVDVAREIDAGLSVHDLASRISDAGLSVVLDPVMNWYSGPVPDPRIAFATASVEDNLRLCEQLPVTSMNALAQLDGFAGLADPEVIATDELVGPFAQLCDRAADVGVDVHLEFVPDTAVPDVGAASEIAVGAGRSNGGILFDNWHFYRGNPDFAALRAVPSGQIFAVQLSDAPAAIRRPLIEDSSHRLLPGDGSFDLDRVVRALVSVGGMERVGAEVFSPELAALGAVRAACISNDRVRCLIDTARTDVPGQPPQ